jgi:pantoate--beta-alanine ligase
VEVLTDLASWRAAASEARARGRRVGLVATMGALHAGHASLFERARAAGDVVIATSFVNPRQFHDAADLAAYPHSPDADRALAAAAGVDVFVSPSLIEMWPDHPAATATTVSVRGLGDTLEGEGRPGHFDGVASVVAKLFVVNGPGAAYFGEKDFQQVAVVRRMVADLAFDVEVVACPTVRDPDGLALSSRNARLSAAGRARALSLSRALARAGETRASARALRALLRAEMDDAGVDVAYAEVVDPVTLAPARDDEAGARRALVAGVIEGVRLIDNGPVQIERGGT